jgi:hypothetical protein
MDRYRAPGAVTGGTLDVNKARLKAALGAMSDGPVVLTIERKKATRTVNQNAYYHAVVVATIAKETEQDPESVHEALKRECNAQCVTMRTKDGETYDMWVGKSTSGLNVNDFSDYVERCRAFAATFLGLEIPDPDTER